MPQMTTLRSSFIDCENNRAKRYTEVDRAFDNLLKNGKLYSMPYRRESMSLSGSAPTFPDYGKRLRSHLPVTSLSLELEGSRMSQRHSVDFDQARPQSNSNAQGFYANQRQQQRPSETEQMMQAKRRMAAQRERELRNYHQEQQYNRSGSRIKYYDTSPNKRVDVTVQGQSDGSLSPNTMNDDDRRELIARQHRALYGNDAPYYEQEANTPRASQPTSGHNSSIGGRGPSPREYGSFSLGQGQMQTMDESSQLNAGEQNQQGQKRPSPNPQTGNSNENSTASPASNATGQNFGIFESTAQQSSRTSTSSPGVSPPRQAKGPGQSVAPIGTRPPQANNPAFAKGRSGTPSSQSPLGHGYNAHNDALNVRGSANDRAPSSASNPASNAPKEQPTNTWGTGSGVWGNSGNNKSVGAVWG